MKIDLRDIQEGETEFAFEETPADLHITEEDTQFAGAINTRLVVYKYGDSLSAKGQTTCPGASRMRAMPGPHRIFHRHIIHIRLSKRSSPTRWTMTMTKR